VKTPALRALDLIFDQVRALRPGTQWRDLLADHRAPACCVPGNRGLGPSGPEPRLSGPSVSDFLLSSMRCPHAPA